MNRGKSLVEMLRFSSQAPHENKIRLESGLKIYRYDPKKSRFTEAIVPDEGDETNQEVFPVPEAGEAPVSGWTEMESTKKRRGVLVLGRAKLKVPRLDNKRIRVGGRIPRIAKARALCPKTITIEEPIQVAPQLTQQPVEVREIPAFSRTVAVKVVPTPVRRKPRTPKIETAPAALAKPLKVIRRRGEQAPKVFETSATIVPRAMLEGIAAEPDDKAEPRHD
jgi:hypothetical protein